MAPGLPENINGSCKASYEQVLGVTEIHFCCIVLFRQIAKAGSDREKGIRCHPSIVAIFHLPYQTFGGDGCKITKADSQISSKTN